MDEAGGPNALVSVQKRQGKLKSGAPDLAPNEEPPKQVPGFNLAGRPTELTQHLGGIKHQEFKVVKPQFIGELNTASYWQFVIRSSKQEWIRFHEDAFSMILFGTYAHAAHNEQAASQEIRTKDHALEANKGKPAIFLDPAVLGASFIQSVEVSIQNTPVTTNALINPHLLQYIHCNNVYNSRAEPYLSKALEVEFTGSMSAGMKRATLPLSYGAWNKKTGNRVPIPMHGIFPFDLKNKTRESIDKSGELPLFFPPDSTFVITLNLFPGKHEGVFHEKTHPMITKYFDTTDTVASDIGLKWTIQDVSLQYESVIMTEQAHLHAMQQFRNGGKGIYDYDIARSQHQPISPNQSYTSNIFNVAPKCRLLYLMCLNDWATFPQDAKHKPLSGFSRFPPGATNLRLGFGGDSYLITENFENFGVRGKTTEISKKIYYEYLRSKRMFRGSFDDLFPANADDDSLLQTFVVDLEDKMSDKIEQLKVDIHYGSNQSKPNLQLLLITVHCNGRAIVYNNSPIECDWVWRIENPQ